MKISKRHSYNHQTDKADISVFIDVFRASTSLPLLFHQGVKEVVLLQNDDLIPSFLDKEYILVSEVYSKGMDNSPSQILGTNLKDKNIVLRTTNFTTAILNNLSFNSGLAASFANIGAITQYIQNQNPETLEIVMASQYSRREAAVEDESCADMLEGLLLGMRFSEIPNLSGINTQIEELKKSDFKYFDHYWKDLDIALTIDQVSIVPRIINENRKIVRFVVD